MKLKEFMDKFICPNSLVRLLKNWMMGMDI